MQLIVLGMHRSGTSTLARLLNLLGVYFGPEGMSTGANPENPKGFWERRDVRQLNDALLHANGCDWNRISTYDPGQTADDVIARFEDHAGKLILEMDAHRPWLMKEPRLCLLLPHWKRLLEVPVCIHILRHPVEVASSLNKRNDIPLPVGLALWEQHVRAALNATSELPGILVSHHLLIDDPMGTVERMHDQLVAHGVTGLRLPSKREIDSFVTPKLHRERRDRPDLSTYLDTPQARLFDALIKGSWPPAALGTPSADVNDILKEYESSLPPMDNTRPNILLASGKHQQTRHDDRQASLHAREIVKLTRLALASEERLKRQIAKLEADTNAAIARASLTSVLEQTIEALTQEKKQLAVAERSAQQDKTRLAMALEQATAELANANERLSVAELQVSRTKAEFSECRETIQQMRRGHDRESNAYARHRETAEETIRALRARIEHLISALEFRESALRQFGNHPLWRLTAPLRWLAGLITNRRRPSLASPLEILRDSDLFDADWYRSRYPDVAASMIDPATHYLDHGAAEGRDPSPRFITRTYMDTHPEVVITGENPLVHFIEQRRILATITSDMKLHINHDGEGAR